MKISFLGLFLPRDNARDMFSKVDGGMNLAPGYPEYLKEKMASTVKAS